LNAPDSIAYRNKHFNYKYEKGFLFHSKCFSGVNGNFPIGFLLWNLSTPKNTDTVQIDISNVDTRTIGIKNLRMIEKENVLNNWVYRPQNSNQYILPALSNGITIKEGNIDTRHRARPDFIASICSKGNDFQNAKYVTILSSPSVSAGAFTVTKDNFNKAVTLFAVRKIPQPTWLNDRNQFLVPTIDPPLEFYTDCIIWSLFSQSNQTTALRNVKYKDKIYQIKNNFFPFKLNEIKQWNISNSFFKSQLIKDEDRFVANWVNDQSLSLEATTVLKNAKTVYKIFYENLDKMILSNWKIETWDAGWYQIRRCLTENKIGIDKIDGLTDANKILAQKILPKIEEYGFLDEDRIYEPSFF
jgi:hypothetical protein